MKISFWFAVALSICLCAAVWATIYKMAIKDRRGGKWLQSSQDARPQPKAPAAAEDAAKASGPAPAAAPDAETAAAKAPEMPDMSLEKLDFLDKAEEPPPFKPGPARDWSQIAAQGSLRVAVLPRHSPSGITGSVTPEDFERALLTNFARQNNLDIECVVARKFSELGQALMAGRCDLIAASIAITPERRKAFAFTTPFRRTVEQIVVPASERSIRGLDDLAGRTGVIQPGTCYWDSMKGLVNERPAIKMTAAPEGLEPDPLLMRVGVGKYQFTVAEDSYVNCYLERRHDIKSVYEFPNSRGIAWPVRKESPALLERLNAFLVSELQICRTDNVKGDMPEIKRRGFLRVLTRNTAFCYFIHRGRSMGFEYDMVAEFAKRQGLVPVMIVPPNWSDLLPWLESGKGDMIAANMTPTSERRQNDDVSFGAPYGSMTQTLVGRSSEARMGSLQELKGRKVMVRRSSSYWSTMSALRDSGLDFKLFAAPEEMDTPEIMLKVASGEIDLSVADDAIVDAGIRAGIKIKGLISVSEPESYAWAFRVEDKALKAAADKFIKDNCRARYHSGFYNIVYKRYYVDDTLMRNVDKELLRGPSMKISPFDEVFKSYGSKYGLNWCLIAAQAFQESQFDPKAQSHLGTIGLLQVMPATARDMGFKSISDVDTGVHAGVRYLRAQLDRLSPADLKDDDMVCFALASYNAGYGHLSDARLLAESMGLNPDVWFGNVEEALKALSNPKVAATARYGYCRSFETVAYVRNIMAMFKHYTEMVETRPAAKR